MGDVYLLENDSWNFSSQVSPDALQSNVSRLQEEIDQLHSKLNFCQRRETNLENDRYYLQKLEENDKCKIRKLEDNIKNLQKETEKEDLLDTKDVMTEKDKEIQELEKLNAENLIKLRDMEMKHMAWSLKKRKMENGIKQLKNQIEGKEKESESKENVKKVKDVLSPSENVVVPLFGAPNMIKDNDLYEEGKTYEATARSTENKMKIVEEDNECWNCDENTKTRKLWKCRHSFCYECLTKMSRKAVNRLVTCIYMPCTMKYSVNEIGNLLWSFNAT